jgi:cation transport regulator ChaB
MPYSRNSELPKAVRQTVPEEKQTQFRRVFNSVYADTKSDQRAFSAAWSAVEKRQMDEDLFTNPAEARTRARMMGIGEEIHTHFMNGQAYYMPAATHEAYMEYYNQIGDIDDKEEPDDLLSRILTAIIQEITKVDMSTLESKASDHNKKHGGKGKVTASTLRQVYDRGIGAYKTNPSSVRPNVSSKEQWAMARVNNFLRTIRTGRFRSGKHDTDLLPTKHPLSTRKNDVWDESELPTEAAINKADKPLNKPFRLPSGSSKKFGVYVKDGDKTKKVTFGDPNMEIRRDDPKARANFRSRHSCDTATDKTTARYWSCRMWEKGATVSDLTKTEIEGKILKTDEEQRIVYGWASVITEGGERVVDRQGDIIEADTLVKAVNDFMEHIRVGKTMHTGKMTGRVIHSLPITKEIGESLGIQSDREGWVVAYKVYDDDVWDKVKSGELAAFSIGGRAIKEKLEDESS